MIKDTFHKDGHHKMRHHTGPEIARQFAAHIQRNFRPEGQGKDWMGGRIDPNAGGAPPEGGATPIGPPAGGPPMPGTELG